MKKTKLFSRIFAAALAAMIAATTLITNSGGGLLAFAEGEETYSVKIISPDVPASGSYTYNFYQIIGGDVDEDGGKNVLGNAKWGDALGGTNFDNVPTGKTPVGSNYSTDANAGIGYYPSSEVLLIALSGTAIYYNNVINQNVSQHGSLYKSAYKGYSNILNSYGVPFDCQSSGSSQDDLINGGNYFSAKFKYNLAKDSKGADTWTGSGKKRDVKGLVEVLDAGLTDGKLKTSDLNAFADLLLNGVEVEIDLGTTTEVTGEDGKTTTKKDTQKYTYNFITGAPQYTQKVTSGTSEYTVTGLKPGYYLVACVGADDKLTNDGYETSMPIKPVSAMLILVGPANNGVTEIVGKNAYTVPTLTFDMYQKPVTLDMGDHNMQIGNSSWDNQNSTGYNHDVNDIDEIITDSNWAKTGSFDYYAADDRQEAILYRIGITLPLNFDQYAESGYFLAVLDQYCHFGTASSGEIARVTNVRPYVYVKHSGSDEYELVGRHMGNNNDSGKGLDENIQLIRHYESTTGTSGCSYGLTGNVNIKTYTENTNLGFAAEDLFCLGDLYTHTTTTSEVDGKETTTTTHTAKYNLKGGDTIYIYYPAILVQKNLFTNENYLLNANRVWAVYTNNPYAKELTNDKTTNAANIPYKYSHVLNGDVGVTPIAEANVNTYGVMLKVDGDAGYSGGAKFALYRVNSKGEKEYAFATLADKCYVKRWIPKSELEKEFTEDIKTVEGVLLNYKDNGNSYCAYLAGNTAGIQTDGVKIKGLAAGDYFLQELTISSTGLSSGKDSSSESHTNIKDKHYELAKNPIKFNVGNEYNQSVAGYLGVDDNQKTFIEKLTVDFAQAEADKERAIETYVYKWDENTDKVADKFEATLSGDTYATAKGDIVIEVYHKTLNQIWLPETGGIGTTIFFIVGGAIVVMATVLIVTRFRVKRERL